MVWVNNLLVSVIAMVDRCGRSVSQNNLILGRADLTSKVMSILSDKGVNTLITQAFHDVIDVYNYGSDSDNRHDRKEISWCEKGFLYNMHDR